MITLLLSLALASEPVLPSLEEASPPEAPAAPDVPSDAPKLEINEVDLVQLARHAPNVMQGMVLKTEPHVDAKGLHTLYKIAVFKTHKGKAPEIVNLWLPGGTQGSLRVLVDGVPDWSEGDEVVLFMKGDGTVPYRGMFTLEHGVLLDPSGRRGVGLKDVADPSASKPTIARN